MSQSAEVRIADENFQGSYQIAVGGRPGEEPWKISGHRYLGGGVGARLLGGRVLRLMGITATLQPRRMPPAQKMTCSASRPARRYIAHHTPLHLLHLSVRHTRSSWRVLGKPEKVSGGGGKRKKPKPKLKERRPSKRSSTAHGPPWRLPTLVVVGPSSPATLIRPHRSASQSCTEPATGPVDPCRRTICCVLCCCRRKVHYL